MTILHSRHSLQHQTYRLSSDDPLHTAYWQQDPSFSAAAASFRKEQAQVNSWQAEEGGSSLAPDHVASGFVGYYVYVPQYHWCEDGDHCQESTEREELIRVIFTKTGQFVERDFCGNVEYTMEADGSTTFKKIVLASEDQPASPLSPCSARSFDLIGLGRREPREGVSTYLQNVIPATALPRTLPPGYEIALITPPRAGVPRRSSHQQLPRLETTTPSPSAPSVQRFNSQPDFRPVRSSLDIRPSPSRSTTAPMTPLRASLDSVRRFPSYDWSPPPVSNLKRSYSFGASKTLATVTEDHPAIGQGAEMSSQDHELAQTASSSITHRSTGVSGWLKYRKIKLLGTEWKRLHYRFNGTLLDLYANDKTNRPLKTLNVVDYSVTQNGMAARTPQSKVSAFMKRLKLSSASTKPLVEEDMSCILELIPEPQRISSDSLTKAPKLHVFAVQTDDERRMFARNVMRRKIEWLDENGYSPILNGREFHSPV